MSESLNPPRSYSITFGFDEPDVGPEPAQGGEEKYDMEKDLLRLMQLQRGFGPAEVTSTGGEVGPYVDSGEAGPLNAQFTNVQRGGSAQMGDVNRFMAGLGVPVTDNVRLGANVMAQQDERQGGATVARPALNLGYGPLSLNAGYLAVSPQQGGAAVNPSYGMNLNLPIAGGDFSGGVLQTAGEKNPYIYAGYQFPFLGGNLGFELSSADRLRNLAALITGRWAF
jgi:hypothetical protein